MTLEERVAVLEQRPFALTEEQINQIANKAAERALENVYAQVGKSVVTKFLWIVGLVAVGAFLYFSGKGTIPLGDLGK